MCIKITGADEGPYPRPTHIALECDAGKDMFCRGFIQFNNTSWPQASSQAVAQGWKESPTGFFHCPACSGK